jgi:hypothetical protein
MQEREVAGRSHRVASKAFIGAALGTLLLSPAMAATTFTFALDDTYTTSAAVYGDGDYLVRTLTRGEVLGPGVHTLTWDNIDQDGYDVTDWTCWDEVADDIAPCRWKLKLLKHKIGYHWEGVIGNTSGSFTHNVFRSMHPPQSLVVAGNELHYTVGYNEWQSASNYFNLSDPSAAFVATSYQSNKPTTTDAFATLNNVTTDGTRMYWANIGGGWSPINFVLTGLISERAYGNFAQGHPVCVNPNGPTACWPQQSYLSVIDENPTQDLAATGIAVQVNGSLLAVAHGRQGVVKLFDKISGALIRTFAIPVNPLPIGDPVNHLAMSPDGDLWVIDGTTLLRYTDLAGTPTLAATLTGFERPLAVTVHPGNDNVVVVAQGGSSQQVKAVDRNGVLLWTYGQAGGYASGPAVANDKLWFRELAVEKTSVAVQPDGSFWVVDTANMRMLHVGANLAYIEQVAYLPHSYVATVDQNDTKRVFSNFLEYEVDTEAPLVPGESASWKLLRNWKAGFPGTADDMSHWLNGLNTVVTLSNGRTYALARLKDTGEGFDSKLVELPDTGPARDTGITTRSACPKAFKFWPCVLYENGDLGYVYGPGAAVNSGPSLSYQTVERRKLSGFDAAGNPQWGAPAALAWLWPTASTPSYRGALTGASGPRFPVTESGNMILFDADVATNEGFHLGGYSLVSGTLWMASPSCWLDGHGCFQTKGVEAPNPSIQYGGNVVWALGKNVIYGFHGEFFRKPNGQVGEANQFMHFDEDGLFVGQFGQEGVNASGPPGPAPVGQAGNAFGNVLVQAGPDAMYWYHNDESVHAGVHRWRIDNLASAVRFQGEGLLNTAIAVRPAAGSRVVAAVAMQGSGVSVPAGQSVSVTVQVSGAAPTGTVQFFDGSNALQSVSLASGVAQITLSGLTAGTHSITAVYAGDDYNTGGTSSVLTVTVGGV